MAHESILAVCNVVDHQRHVFVRVDVVAIADDPPLAMTGWQTRLGDAMHEPFVLEAERDELRDSDECEAVLRRKLLELRAARRGAILIQDLAQDARGTQSRETREVHRRLRVPDALKHTAIAGAQREHVSTMAQV